MGAEISRRNGERRRNGAEPKWAWQVQAGLGRDQGASRRRGRNAGSQSAQRLQDYDRRTNTLGGYECAAEVLRIERAQVFESLADPDQLDREAEFVGDRNRDPASRGPVELRQDDPGHLHGLAEEAGLLNPV